MNFAAAKKYFALALLYGSLCSNAPAQGIQVDLEEFRRLQGEVADLRDANASYQKRISELSRRIDQLQTSLREANERSTMKMGDFATREDLKKIVDRIVEVDQKREADRKLILEEFESLGKKLAQTPAVRNAPREKPASRQTEKQPETIEGTFYPHKVAKDETFSEILAAYNKSLEKEGRPTIRTSQVRDANPNINLDRIRVGQEILLPLPDKK